MNRFLPKSMAGQMILTLIIVLLIVQGANIFLLVGQQRIADITGQFRRVVETMTETAKNLPETFSRPLPYAIKLVPRKGFFYISAMNRAQITANTERLPALEKRLKAALIEEGVTPLSVYAVIRELKGLPQFKPPPGMDRLPARPFRPPFPPGPPELRFPGLEEITVSVEIRPGIYLNALAPYRPVGIQTARLSLATGILLIATICVVWFPLRRITHPLNKLAVAADQLGRGNKVDRLKENGPKEVRLAAQAFNQMQDRMMRLFETQRTMLRAVGHDLRTPLTSLRIRAEYLPENEGRDRIIELLDEMTSITEEVLNWAKDATAGEDPVSVDLDAMLSSIADDYSDHGETVQYAPGDTIILDCRRISLKRALRNLIDNALKYGMQANVSAKQQNGSIYIYVDDEGPGIPEEKLDDVLKPFVRLEASRNKETGGRGLGLSLVLAVVEAHGGRLNLSNRETGGLRAEIRLPQRIV